MKVTISVFIAGAKILENERNAAIATLSSMNQEPGSEVYWNVLSFKDFDIALTNKENGQQEIYNFYIRNKADVCVFIIDGTVGDVTKEEFDLAWKCFKELGRPRILVFGSHMQRNYPFTKELESSLKSIGQYYTDYEGCEELKGKLYVQLNKYCKEFPLIKLLKYDFKESVKGFNGLVDNVKKDGIQPDSSAFEESLKNINTAATIGNETTISIILSNCLMGFTKAAEYEKREFLLFSHTGIILCLYHLGEIDVLIAEKEKISNLEFEKTFWDNHGETIKGVGLSLLSFGIMIFGKGSVGAGALKFVPSAQKQEKEKVKSRIKHFNELKNKLIQFIDDIVFKNRVKQ